MAQTGLQAMFPIYLAREQNAHESKDAYNSAIAQNENNLNQNLESLYNKLIELEERIDQL
ncbi:MAG: hypothetical protein PHT58_04770 [Eubacteriales bacterium]|nr:hypothetical protein [Eubacteriales bacterium]